MGDLAQRERDRQDKMKFVVAILALLALTNAVPVQQMPEAEQAPATPAEAPAAESKEAPAAEEPKSAEAVKEQALNQVMSFISEMAQPMSTEEHDALKDIISTGGDILMQAEKKAREFSKLRDAQTLVQTDSATGLFGMKSDGSIDADAAADQMTEILSKMASPSNPLTSEEKNVLHELISGFSRAFAPTKETTQALQKDFEKLVGQFAKPSANDKKDELTGATNLLSVFSESKQPFDTKILTDLTEKFLDSMEKQFKEESH